MTIGERFQLHDRALNRPSPLRLWMLVWLVVSLAQTVGCGKTNVQPSTPPAPIDFAEALQYASRAALVYESDDVIAQRGEPGHRFAISPISPLGAKTFVETDEARRIQWVVVRGTANLNNIKMDIDYNKVVDERLQVPLHKGFADTALFAYRFAKPLLRPGYEIRVTGHSLGGAAAAIVLMLLKEDGAVLGRAMTFGQPKVTNREGVRKYRSLPLLRFVNDKDPVPLMPPLEIFAFLDEGSFRHFGPEVVLEDGAAYRYYSDHDAERLSIASFWRNLSGQDIPDHFIKNYIDRLQQKLAR